MKTASQGIGFMSILTLIFIALKLAEIGVVASWSWWWVLAPLWAPWVFFLVLGPGFVMVYAVQRVWERR